MRRASLIWPFFLAAAAVPLWLYSERMPLPWNFVFSGWAILQACTAAAMALDWVIFRMMVRLREFKMADRAGEQMVISARQAYVNAVAGLTEYQIEALGKTKISVEIIPGDPEPLYFLRLAGGALVPWEFVDEFLAAGRGDFLPEVRQWTDGSWRHTSADALTDYFIVNGYAEPAAGNKPARWLDRATALRSIGVQNEKKRFSLFATSDSDSE